MDGKTSHENVVHETVFKGNVKHESTFSLFLYLEESGFKMSRTTFVNPA